MNFSAAVAMTQPNCAAPYGLPVGFHIGQLTEPHTGNIPLPRLDLGHTAAVCYCLPLQTAGVKHDLTAAVATAQPDSVAVFSCNRGGGYGQSADTAAYANWWLDLFWLYW